jgi:FkbM family methyltransferase
MKLAEVKQNFKEGKINLNEYIITMHSNYRTLFDYADYIQATDIEKIEIAHGDVVFTFRGGIKMVCDQYDMRQVAIEALNFSGDTWKFSAYEKVEFDILAGLLTDGMTMLDIGANIGWFSLQLANRFPKANILAFEPIPQTFEYLTRNVALNGFNNIKTYNSGFLEQAEIIPFYVFAEQGTNASSIDFFGQPETKVIDCQVFRLDEFAKSMTVDLIKCDVEGAELNVLKGAAETLRRDKPVIYAEICVYWAKRFGWEPNDLVEYLGSFGYVGFIIRDGKLVPITEGGSINETNFIFLPKERIPECA